MNYDETIPETPFKCTKEYIEEHERLKKENKELKKTLKEYQQKVKESFNKYFKSVIKDVDCVCCTGYDKALKKLRKELEIE